ncbi:MAG: hypothetical protein J2P22_13800 [Nocardioides sp.]|nr:hypothetical protein [Nocardioides sp.]
MNVYLTEGMARTTIDDRVRAADQQHLARESQRRERTPAAKAATRGSRRHSRLWKVIYLRHTYS